MMFILKSAVMCIYIHITDTMILFEIMITLIASITFSFPVKIKSILKTTVRNLNINVPKMV